MNVIKSLLELYVLCVLWLAPAKQLLLGAALAEVHITLCCTAYVQVSWLTQQCKAAAQL